MSFGNFCFKVIKNRDKIIANMCFWGMLCFNFLNVCLLCFFMFTYDGGTENVKAYYEIRNIETAHGVFLQYILTSCLYELLFAFPLLISWLFVRKIEINAVMLQLLPILVILGQIMFFD